MPPLQRWLTPAVQHPFAALIVLEPRAARPRHGCQYRLQPDPHHQPLERGAGDGLRAADLCLRHAGVFAGRGIALPILLPVYRAWRWHHAAAGGRGRDRRRAADRAVLAGWAAALACLGWLPGGLIFPIVLALFSGPLPWPVAVHLVDPLHPLRPDRLDLLHAAGAVDQPAGDLPKVVATLPNFCATAAGRTSPRPAKAAAVAGSFRRHSPGRRHVDHGRRSATVHRRRVPLVPRPRHGLDRAGHGGLSTDAVRRGTAFANPGRPDRRPHGRVSFLIAGFRPGAKWPFVIPGGIIEAGVPLLACKQCLWSGGALLASKQWHTGGNRLESRESIKLRGRRAHACMATMRVSRAPCPRRAWAWRPAWPGGQHPRSSRIPKAAV